MTRPSGMNRRARCTAIPALAATLAFLPTSLRAQETPAEPEPSGVEQALEDPELAEQVEAMLSELEGAPEGGSLNRWLAGDTTDAIQRLSAEIETRRSEPGNADAPDAEAGETPPGDPAGETEESGADRDEPSGATDEPPAAENPFDGEVRVDEFDLVDLHVQNEDLGRVLQLLSIQSRKNIVSSRDVSATITADLYGVTFYEALDAILHVNGFGYREQGNFIYVYTREELERIAEASRRQATRVVALNYLNAVDAARFSSPLLSDVGTITTPNEADDFEIPVTSPAGKDDYASEALLVIHDYEENIEEIVALIEQIDTRPRQVLVEATILQAAITEENAFGIDFSLIGDLDFTEFINPLAAANDLIAGRGTRLVNGSEEAVAFPGPDGESRAVTSNIGNVTGKSTLKAGLIDEDVAIFMRVLDEVTDVTVISNPKVLTLNRQAARVLVGTRVGFLNTTVTETATTQSVEFLDTGTQLLIRPFVTTEDLIRLEVKPQVSTASLRESSTANGLPVTIPDEDTTEIVTNLLVRDGQTVVLGGLFTESTQYTRRQIPVAGDIPLIGAAFRGQDDNVSRNEIIFLITPTVVDDTLLTLEGERATDYIEHARVGAREGLLPWSRDRQVGKLLIEAEQAARDGDPNLALLKVQRALALSPHSPDAHAMRERLTRDRTVWPSRSILDDIMRREPDAGRAPPPAESSRRAPNPSMQPAGARTPRDERTASEPASAPSTRTGRIRPGPATGTVLLLPSPLGLPLPIPVAAPAPGRTELTDAPTDQEPLP